MIRLILTLILGTTLGTSAYAGPLVTREPELRHFLSTSLFMAFNLLPLDDSPHYFQLNYGRALTDKDILVVEAITWRYHAPLGIPYSDTGESYPGYARDIGIGLAYQRFLWRGAYAMLHATPFVQLYHDEDGNYIQTGFQLFLALRVGYHFSFWSDQMFIEPSVASTAWPINTNLPGSFQRLEDKWPSYFLFEPGLMIGVNL